MTDREPKVSYRNLKIKDFWKGRTVKVVKVGSGPLPTPEELPPENPARDVTQGEVETQTSPTYPTTKLPVENVPSGGLPSKDKE